MTKSPVRVLIFNVDQFGDGMLAITDNSCGHTLGGRNKFAIHHQHAIIVSSQILFDDDLIADGFGALKSINQLFFIGEIWW